MTMQKIMETIQKYGSFSNLGILVSCILLMTGFIGQYAFVLLIVISIFKDSLEELSFGFNDLKMKRKQLDVLIDKEIEPAQELAQTGQGCEVINHLSVHSEAFVSEEQQIIYALSSDKYTFRNIAGIAQDTNLSFDSARKVLANLITRGYVTMIQVEGTNTWVLTRKGRNILPNVLVSLDFTQNPTAYINS